MNKVTIDIFNSSYTLKTDYDSEYVNRLATYVDKTMKNVHEKSATASTQKVAVLSSVSIADELFRANDGKEPLSSYVDDRVDILINMIDSAMK